MKRYKVITYEGETVRRNLEKDEAKELVKELNSEFKIPGSFYSETDIASTIWVYIKLVMQALYLPVYFTGFVLLCLGRIIIGIAYMLLLQKKAGLNVFKFMFTWRQ